MKNKKIILRIVFLLIAITLITLIVGLIFFNKIKANRQNIEELKSNSSKLQEEIESVSNIDNSNNNEIKEVLSPRGFTGSSMHEVVLYADNTVYVVVYDGGGHEKSNIVSETLIARNVDTIEYNGQGEEFKSMIVKGKKLEIVKTSYNWIEFESETEKELEIKKALSPSGFSGSSTIEVVLYADNTVYVINYDGSGYEKNNIIGKTLIAKNADTIEYNGQGETFESIIVKGKKLEIVKTSYNWIEFESETEKELEIKKALTASGFVGSSMHEVVLYADNTVYVVVYDGGGHEKSNIVRKTLIAKNADTIEYNGQGEEFKSIIVKGKKLEVVDTSQGTWIEFESETEKELEIKKVLSPSGFSGSSTIEVVLYADNTVYVINYDGSGYEKNNIIEKTLIAKNADTIEYNGQGETFESIIVKGKKLEIVKTPYSWIKFDFK